MKMTIDGYTDDYPFWFYLLVHWALPYLVGLCIVGALLAFAWLMSLIFAISFAAAAPWALAGGIVGAEVDRFREHIARGFR